jgi:hypothetical protein
MNKGRETAKGRAEDKILEFTISSLLSLLKATTLGVLLKKSFSRGFECIDVAKNRFNMQDFRKEKVIQRWSSYRGLKCSDVNC